MNQWQTWTGTLMCLFLLGGSPAYAEQPEAAGKKIVPAQEAQDGIQERSINGIFVPVQTQRNLGLVTVGVVPVGRVGACSGTLLNRFWVLTADHCVTTNGFVPNGNIVGLSAPLNLLPITAAWAPGISVIPTRLVRQWGPTGLDLALIFLGGGDFGPVNTQLLFSGPVTNGMTVTSYGRGMTGYASAGPPPVPANLGGGLYHSAPFVASNAGSLFYTLAVNAPGQVGAGGDSGGPDIVVSSTVKPLGGVSRSFSIVGVHSTCHYTGWVASMWTPVAGQPPNWNWVTRIDTCNSAPIANTRNLILVIIQDPRFMSKDFIKLDPITSTSVANSPPLPGTKQSTQVDNTYPVLIPPPPQTTPPKVLPRLSEGTSLEQNAIVNSQPLLLKPSTTTTLNSSTSLNGGIFLRGVPQEGSPPAGTPPAKPKPAP